MSGQPTIQFVGRPGILDLGWGHPHPEALPVAAWQAATEQTLREAGATALTYGHAAGPAGLRAWLASTVDGGDDPERVFVTAGASHALELVAGVLMRRGETVLVDCPTYHLAPRILVDAGVRLAAVPADAFGLEPAAIGELPT